MKEISIDDFEEHFDLIFEDVATEKSTYLIKTPKGDLVFMPDDEYCVLNNIYEDWLQQRSSTES